MCVPRQAHRVFDPTGGALSYCHSICDAVYRVPCVTVAGRTVKGTRIKRPEEVFQKGRRTSRRAWKKAQKEEELHD